MPPLDPPDTENTAPRTTGVPRALLLFGALAIAGAVTYATPALEPLRPWTDGSAVPFTRFLEFRPPVRETIGRIRERQRARFATVQGGSAGTAVSLYRLFYDAFPGGGEVSLSVDGAAPRFVSTAAATLEDRVEDLPVADGPHVLEVHAGRGDLRLFGVVSERDRPGVVVDGLMLVGAFTRVLLHWDADHWTRQLELREPDLLVFWLGGNDSVSHTWGFDHDRYVADYVEVLRRARRGSRPVACLVMSVTDSRRNTMVSSSRDAESRGSSPRSTRPLDRRAAPFFDTHAATGGRGAARRWYLARPRLLTGDFRHPTRQGARVLGSLLYRALLRGYDDWLVGLDDRERQETEATP